MGHKTGVPEHLRIDSRAQLQDPGRRDFLSLTASASVIALLPSGFAFGQSSGISPRSVNALLSTIVLQDVSPTSSNTTITSNPDDGSTPAQSVNGRMLTIAGASDGSTVVAGSFSNIWLSADGGQTWNQATWPQPASGQFGAPGAIGGWCVVDVAISPVDPQTILAITSKTRAAVLDCGIWRSSDGGSTWTLVYQFPPDGSSTRPIPPPAGQLAWQTGNGNVVYAAGGSALAISQNAGVSFQPVTTVGRINHVAVAPFVPSAAGPMAYALGNGVMYVSVNGGPWIKDTGPIHPNWGGATGSGGLEQAASVLVVSPRRPTEVFLVANANGGKTVSPLAQQDPFVSVYGDQHHFVYQDIAGTLWDSWWDGNSWSLQQITTLGGLLSHGPPCAGSVFISVYNNQQHIGYLDRTGTIWDAWWDGDNGTWQLQQINSAGGNVPNAPSAAARLFVSAYNNQQHFAYLDGSGTIWDAWWDGDNDAWKLQQINAIGGLEPTAPLATSWLFVSVYNNQQHFAYLDSVGTIWDVWWDGDHSWQVQQINAPGGRAPSAPLAKSDLFVSVFKNQQHFAYLDNVGKVWDAWWDGDNDTWQLQQINSVGGRVPSAPLGTGGLFVSVFVDPEHPTNRPQHHFTYLATFTIWDAWWDGDSWQTQQINNPGGRTPLAPAAQTAVFVSQYKNQQHFTYRDSGGILWDSWWDGENDVWSYQQINAGPMLWRGDFRNFSTVNTQSTWQRVVPPDMNQQGQDSGSTFLVATRPGRGDLLFYGAQRTKPYVGPLDPVSASSWTELDEGTNVHWDLHGIALSPDFNATFQGGTYELQSGTVWLLSDGGIYRSTDGGKHFDVAANVTTLSCVNVAGVAIEGQTALSLNTGDNDGFYSMDGGATWTSQDYGGADNDCSYADPLRPHSMLVFTPRWDPDGNSGSAAAGQTIAVYEAAPTQLPDVRLGTGSRHVVPGPPLSDSWNAKSTFGLRGYRPIVLNLPGDGAFAAGDYIFIRFKTDTSQAVLLRTQKLLEIDSRDDWNTVATSASDGTRVFQQGPALHSADLGVVQASGGHTSTVFYVGGNAANELWKWASGGTDGRTAGPPASNSPYVSVYNNQQHFAYLDGAGAIWDAWWNGENSTWQPQQINAANGRTPSAPPAAGGPFVSIYNNQQHFAYLDTAGTIWDSWWDGDTWNVQHLNAADGKTPGAPPAASGLFVSVYNNQQHFAYLDSAGTIWDAWWDGDNNTWQSQQINGADGRVPGAPAVSSDLFVSSYNNQQHFAYLDGAGTIWDAWWDGDNKSWQPRQVNGAGGVVPGAPPAARGLFVSIYNNQQHFAYLDSAGTIWDAWWDGDNNTWQPQQINAAGGRVPVAPSAASDLFVSVYKNQQHFAYLDNAGTIWDAWWDGDNDTWQPQQINVAGGRVPSAPPAASGLFVSAYTYQQPYTNQQHFAYLDSAGTIWDAWWDEDSWQVQQINSAGWQKMVPGASANQARRFFVSPYDPNLIYLLDEKNVKRSDDGGSSWSVDVNLEDQLTCGRLIPIDRPDTGDLVDVVLTDMQFDPSDPLTRFAVGEGGAFFTKDGVTWDHLLDTGALSGRPVNCYYDSVSNPSEKALYVALAGRGLLKISPLP